MNEQDYAIVVGIDNYREDQRLKLAAAEHDAVQFLRWLRSPAGGAVPKKNTHVFLSRFYPPNPRPLRSQPMKNDIDDCLVEFGVDQETRIGRRFYFYFAGHGIGPNLREVALLMANATRRRLGNNLGIFDYLDFFLNWAPFDEIVILLDCCRDIEDSFSAIPAIFTKDKRPDAPIVKHMIALGSRYGEKSWEVKIEPTDWRPRCLFTTVLLEGLHRAVDGHGRITADSLATYLNERLPTFASQNRRRQRPEILGEFQKEIVFGRGELPAVRIPLPDGWHGPLSLCDNQGEAARFEAAPGDTAAEVSIRPGLYSLREAGGAVRYLIVEPGSQEARYVTIG
ncbi:MAG: caspase family protein [Chloroflexota bacterium]